MSPIIEQCSICYYNIKKNSQKKTLSCTGNHSFHQKCIWKWIVHNNSCPLCRETVSKYPSYQCEYNEYLHYVNALTYKQVTKRIIQVN